MWTLTQVMNQYSSYLFLSNKGRTIFKKEMVYNGRYNFLFWFHRRRVKLCQATEFCLTESVRHSLLKQLAITRCIWTTREINLAKLLSMQNFFTVALGKNTWNVHQKIAQSAKFHAVNWSVFPHNLPPKFHTIFSHALLQPKLGGKIYNSSYQKSHHYSETNFALCKKQVTWF